MSERFFNLYSNIFYCFGITHQIPINSSEPPNFTESTLWMGFLELLLLSSVVVLIHFHDQLLSDTGALSTGIDGFQLLSPIVCHIIIIAESLFCAGVMERMCRAVRQIEEQVKESGSDVDQQLLHRKYLRKFVVSQLIPIAIESYITLSIGKAEEWQRHWIARTFSFNASRLAAMHYILWADYLASRGEFLCAELKSLDCAIRWTKRRPEMDRSLFERLRRLKEIHRTLWRLTQEVNERFKWFILSGMTNFFLCITIDLYWIYGNFRFGGNPFAVREWGRRKVLKGF